MRKPKITIILKFYCNDNQKNWKHIKIGKCNEYYRCKFNVYGVIIMCIPNRGFYCNGLPITCDIGTITKHPNQLKSMYEISDTDKHCKCFLVPCWSIAYLSEVFSTDYRCFTSSLARSASVHHLLCRLPLTRRRRLAPRFTHSSELWGWTGIVRMHVRNPILIPSNPRTASSSCSTIIPSQILPANGKQIAQRHDSDSWTTVMDIQFECRKTVLASAQLIFNCGHVQGH
jgi:hypothetical protein